MDGDKTFYGINRLPDQALVERLPANELVELYENRIGITFEVDPAYIVAKTIIIPPNYFQVFCNVILIVLLLIIIGKYVISSVAARSVQRHLVDYLPENEKYKPIVNSEES